MKALMTANMIYVRYPIFANAGGVTMTTMNWGHMVSNYLEGHERGSSGRTLKIQLAVVDMAFAGARIDSGVTSAGYSHVMPSQPTAKNELKTKRNTAAAMPALLLTSEYLLVAASTTIEPDMPTAPKSISLRRPNFSMVKMAIQEAMKYSVPFNAASRRLKKLDRPMRTKSVAA